MATFTPASVAKDDPHSDTDSESSDILDLKDDEGWEDAEPDEEQDQIVSLFDDKVFANTLSMLNHCKEKYNFDFLSIRDKFALDFYGNIKLVNFIRSEVKEGRSVSPTISQKDFDDEKYLKPVLEDDALLFNLDELPEASGEPEILGQGKPVEGSSQLLARVAELEEELRKTQLQFSDYRSTVSRTLDERWNEGLASSADEASKEEKRDDDSHYFSSYSYNGLSQSSPHLLI